MRRVIFYLTLSLFMSVLPNATANHAIPSEFRFIGSGYGHGVGMSQIGARGQAIEGKNAVEILNYYYPGTEVTPYPDNALIRVNLMNQVQSANLKIHNSKGGFTLYLGDIPVSENPEPYGKYDGTFSATFNNFAGFVTPFLTSPTAKLAPLNPAQAWTVRWESDTVISLGNESETSLYRYGQVTFKSTSTLLTSYLSVTNSLRLHDEYLWGLGEVPSSWPPAALEAQAIAARTYALGKLQRLRPECDCNIYDTTIDQNFVGYAKEIEPIWGIKWKEAVSRTLIDEDNALTVTLAGRPISAFYFSSSGGNTQNVKEVWGSQISYLQGVPDPWSLDPLINRRFAVWSRFVTQSAMAQAFALPNVIDFSIDSKTATGSIASITAFASTGQKSTLSGEIFRSRVRLPSTWIRNDRPIPKFYFLALECSGNSKRSSQVCFN
jgi:stage II sporulation protein D